MRGEAGRPSLSLDGSAHGDALVISVNKHVGGWVANGMTSAVPYIRQFYRGYG